MNRYRHFFTLIFCAVLIVSGFTSCKVGEDDPFISLRSRDARIKANWKLGKMENHHEIRVINQNAAPEVTTIAASFNGYDLHVRVARNGILLSDTTFGYNYLLKIKDDGKSSYENTVIQNLIGVKSTGEDNWYWLDTDKKKARIFLGEALQFPATAGLSLLPSSQIMPGALFFSDFTVDGLRHEELQLSYNKITQQVTNNGYQQITASSQMTFSSK